jgi:hypothetical protein
MEAAGTPKSVAVGDVWTDAPRAVKKWHFDSATNHSHVVRQRSRLLSGSWTEGARANSVFWSASSSRRVSENATQLVKPLLKVKQ